VSEQLAGLVFREAAEGVPVGQPPVDEVVGVAAARRRRARAWTGGVLGFALLVVGVGTWVTTRPPDDGLPDVSVRPEANPANIEWYANGVLHLREVAVEIPQVTALLQVPDGVVYSDRAGHVVLVNHQGDLTTLGRSEPGTPIVASPVERGWVAWLEPGSSPDLVVHDTLSRHELARRPVTPGTRPIAIDQDRLYFNERGESWSWQLPDIPPALVPGADLYDVASAVRVLRAAPGTMQIRQPLLAIEVIVPGQGAVLSQDGGYVLTRVDAEQPDVVRIYDSETGDPVASGLADEELAVAAAFGPDSTVTYVVTSREHGTDGDDLLRLSESRSFELRTCQLVTGACETLRQLGSGQGLPVLPGN
jgi:hypothetical protein